LIETDHSFNTWFEKLQDPGDINCCVFPYSGSGVALFAPWKGKLGENVGLYAAKLPGRETRINEPLRTDLVSLAFDLAKSIMHSPLTDKPLVLVGFSMGALLAYEVARSLRDMNLDVSILIAGAARAPHGRWSRGRLHKLRKDDDFIRELNALYSAIPQAIIADPAARRLLIPIIRADITLFETYRFTPCDPLPCELITLTGTDDPVVKAKHIAPWRQLAKTYRHRSFPGGHYFAKTERNAVLETIARRIHRMRLPSPER